jgi:hypothetical protein
MFKTLLIFLVISVLMEDSLSIRKTAEEVKEDEKVARAVNETLAEEEKKKAEEEKKKMTDEKKKQQNQEKKQEDGEEKASVKKPEDQDEACPPVNLTCPVVKPCLPCKKEDCPQKECKECGPCPEVKPDSKECLPCKECGECPEVMPCPSLNQTSQTAPEGCPEANGLSVPLAMVVGALISLGSMGLAAVVGLILRYVPPLISGILFLTVIIVIWFLSSHYPDTARELGGRAVTLIREAALALSHRAMAVIRRHQDQVGVLIRPNLFFRMSSMIPKVCTKIFYVVENNF